MQKEILSCCILARKQLVTFPSSYLVEYAFSVVTDLLQRLKRNQLETAKPCILKLKLINPDLRIKEINNHQHQAQRWH